MSGGIDPGILKYLVSDTIRNRRRTFSAIVGVLLAIAFISGTFISLDSANRSAFDAYVANIPGDFGMTVNAPGSADLVYDQILGVPGVTNVSMYTALSFGGIAAPGTNLTNVTPQAPAYWWIEGGRLPSMLNGLKVTGALPTGTGEVALSPDLATWLNVSIGDTVVLFAPSATAPPGASVVYSVNRTVVGLVEGSGYPSGYFGGYGPPGMALLNLEDLVSTAAALGYPTSFYSVSAEIWIDRARFIDLYDIPESEYRLGRLQRQLDSIAMGNAGWVSDNILQYVQNYQNLAGIQRLIGLMLAAPVLVLGLYVGAVGVDLGHAERRREMAVLAARGASRHQVVRLLLLEAVAGGVIAAIGGLALGIVVSQFMIGIMAPTWTSVTPTWLILTRDTVLTTFVLAIGLMAVSSYRSARRTASLPISETLRFYSPGETKTAYRPTADIVFVALAVLIFAGAWWVLGGSSGFVGFLISAPIIILVPVAPFFLIVGATRLLTRSTGRTYELVSRACRPFAKALTPIVTKNLGRNPRRASNVAVIIALGLAFGVLVLSVIGSIQGYDVRVLRAQIGSDLSVSGPRPPNATFAQDLGGVAGVAAVTAVTSLPAVSPYAGGWWPTTYALQPETYFSTVQPEPWCFDSMSAAEIQKVLEVPGNLVVTRQYFDSNYLTLGDRVSLYVSLYDGYNSTMRYVNGTVAGVVRLLPGMGSYGAGVYASEATFQPFMTNLTSSPYMMQPAPTYLVRLSAGADWRQVKQTMLDIGASGVVSLQEQLQAQSNSPMNLAMIGILDVEVAFVIVILTAGLGLIVFAASFERDVEFAAIRARGASRLQAAALLLGEAFSIMLLGLAVGAVVGLVAAWGLVQVFSGAFMGGGTAIPMFLEVPLSVLWLVIAAPIAMMLSVSVVSLRTTHMNVARVLKLRGG